MALELIVLGYFPILNQKYQYSYNFNSSYANELILGQEILSKSDLMKSYLGEMSDFEKFLPIFKKSGKKTST